MILSRKIIIAEEKTFHDLLAEVFLNDLECQTLLLNENTFGLGQLNQEKNLDTENVENIKQKSNQLNSM